MDPNMPNKKENKEKKESTAGRDFLRKIEKEMQDEWYSKNSFSSTHVKNWEQKMSREEKNGTKFLVTFPYPYMNGLLHLGHAFSVTKCDFQSRYQRLNGKNVLFPFSFHCTGMPIGAAANRVKEEFEEIDKKKSGIEIKEKEDNKKDKKKKEEKKKQIDILKQMKLFPESLTEEEQENELRKFSDSKYWIEFFPELGKKDLMDFGLSADFSRSFVTTDIQQFYDKFVEWQFLKLKSEGKIYYGPKETIFSIKDNQACADHDRAEGEGVKPQEYSLIRVELIEFKDERLAGLFNQGKKIFLPAATLRPETMYGQTNIFLLPKGMYGVYEMKDNEIYICGTRSALNMAYQDLTLVEKKAVPLFEIKGSELIGSKVRAPLCQYDYVYILPMESISMEKGTGVVTSVPSDAPDDYINLEDLKKDSKLRDTFKLTEDMIKNFPPINIIRIPGFDGLPAQIACENFKVVDRNDKENLKKAKEAVYSQGYYQGELIVGVFAGSKVEDAKAKVKEYMYSNKMAQRYFEPESKVVARSGEECVVTALYQWIIKYGEEDWKKLVKDHVNSDNFRTYTSGVRHSFNEGIDWFSEWGCSRTFGLGTKIPWDKQYLIESLSDSTIYMSFYTIYNYMAGKKKF
jgi:leucyl-tRNA synthetase